MQEEFRVTEEWLIKCGVSLHHFELFVEHFQNGSATVSEFLKFCEERKLLSLVQSTILKIPKNPEPLVLDEYLGGDIYYNGDVHVKKGFECSGNILCEKLKVDEKLVVGGDCYVSAYVIAKIVYVLKNASISGKVIAETIVMRDEASILGDASAGGVSMSENATIFGDVITLVLVMKGTAMIMGVAKTEYLNKGPENVISIG